ncbi:MAG: ribulose-phosphate 3-epimerase [Kiritimatiellae bacterium]|nr:ribulose-phosphate 3-epimerase [Kiritimatiellia bacterium]
MMALRPFFGLPTACAAIVLLILLPAMNEKIYIWPSLLAGNFGRLEESALNAQAAGADALHLDIMDGHFVPNLSMGPDVVKMARRCLNIPLSVHLMLSRPDQLAETFIKAGATTLTIHVESSCDVLHTLRRIRALGATPGVALNPETPFEAALPFLGEVDEVLCMTVHPGFGGQKFMPEVLPKITAIRRTAQTRPGRKRDRDAILGITVDGGIDLNTVTRVAEAGANIMVAGSALFKSKTMAQDLRQMREKARAAFGKGLAGRQQMVNG